MTTAADTRALDAAYRPFPPFVEWQARTSVESARWSALVTRLKEAKQAAATLTTRALEVAKRAAAFDTGALENLYETDRGFTYSVAFQTGAWELGLLERGEQVRPLFEAQMRAYDLVLSLATGSEPVSEAAIRELHTVICAAQDTYDAWTGVGWQKHKLQTGIYKALPNHVRTRKGEDHSYAPVDMTPQEMYRLVQELRSETFLTAHPIQQAAYAHYCFVAIHPFADGNGRVARALASLYTYRVASAPIIILSEDKLRYLDALAKADDGDEQAFVLLMLKQAIGTLELIDDDLANSSKSSYDEALASMGRIFYSPGGLSPEATDSLGRELLKLFADAWRPLLAREEFTSEINVGEFVFENAPLPRQGYRVLLNDVVGYVQANLSAKVPGVGEAKQNYKIYLPQGDVGEELLLAAPNGRTLAVSLSDMGTPTALTRMRIQIHAETAAAELIAELAKRIRANLQRKN